MPRLPYASLTAARSLNPFLPPLLRACRDLQSAQNELRWLREHIANQFPRSSEKPNSTQCERAILWRFCLERQRGKPLQYIIGSQPFGDLNIQCEKGVLIPRPETERYTLLLASRLRQFYKGKTLRIIEPCTGTGCISLLLYNQLWRQIEDLRIAAFDFSSRCLAYVKKNHALAIKEGKLPTLSCEAVCSLQADLFKLDYESLKPANVLISNPPYISPASFNKDTQRSVRSWEPISALVPPSPTLKSDASTAKEDLAVHGDSFYPALLRLAESRGCELVLMEVGDHAQARRVMTLAKESNVWTGGEIWHDDLWKAEVEPVQPWTSDDGFTRSIGEGEGRAIVLWRGQGHTWLGYIGGPS